MSDLVEMKSIVRRGPYRWIAVAGLLALALAGCTSNPVQPVPTGSSSSTPAAAASSGAPAASPSPSPSETGIPLTVTCDEVLSPQAVYAFNPNFGADPRYAAASDSTAAEMVKLKGIACGLLNQSSGEKIEVAVARLTPAAIEARKNSLVTASQQVPTFSPTTDEGYFSVADGVGRADAFVGDYWIMTDSPIYFEPGDAQYIVETVASALS